MMGILGFGATGAGDASVGTVGDCFGKTDVLSVVSGTGATAGGENRIGAFGVGAAGATGAELAGPDGLSAVAGTGATGGGENFIASPGFGVAAACSVAALTPTAGGFALATGSRWVAGTALGMAGDDDFSKRLLSSRVT